jgi:hypothetical protein
MWVRIVWSDPHNYSLYAHFDAMRTVEKCQQCTRQKRLTGWFLMNWPTSEAVSSRVRCLDGIARGFCATVTAEADTRRVLQEFLRGSEGPPDRVPSNAQVLCTLPPRSPFSRPLIPLVFMLYIAKVANNPAPEVCFRVHHKGRQQSCSRVHRLTGVCAPCAGGLSTWRLALRGPSRRMLN